jgi:hypothetical protein
MSGRSAKDALDKMATKAKNAYKKAKDAVTGGDPDDVPLGGGMAERARENIKSRKSRLDKAIEDSGG